MNNLKSMDKGVLTINIVDVLYRLESESNNRIKFSNDALNLILGTIAQESNFGMYKQQLNNGPAMGIIQMEGKTAKDIFENYLIYNKDLRNALLSFSVNIKDFNNIKELESEIKNNNDFAIAICRIHYYRLPNKLPTNEIGYAEFWKKHYNTIKGKGSVDEFICNYKKYLK